MPVFTNDHVIGVTRASCKRVQQRAQTQTCMPVRIQGAYMLTRHAVMLSRIVSRAMALS